MPAAPGSSVAEQAAGEARPAPPIGRGAPAVPTVAARSRRPPIRP